jgi:DNA (cytosine-5)-methyltransferase 1
MVARVPAWAVQEMMRVLDLFSGIGGFSLGLERTGGFKTVAFCEIEEFPRRVLASHWPGVPIYDDVRELSRARLAADGLADVDVICGGFPCQDISFAGRRAGLEGARSGLWGEYQRLVGELRPRFVIVENVPGLLSLGMGTVCGDLAALGYDAVWDCIPASAVGAPHRRDRVWIIAHAECHELRQQPGRGSGTGRAGAAFPGEHGAAQPVADTDFQGLEERRGLTGDDGAECETAVGGRASMADSQSTRRGEGCRILNGMHGAQSGGRPRQSGGSDHDFAGWWQSEPDVGRVAHGVPARVDRLKGLGNAVVPQIPELIGRAILAAEGLAP